MKYKIYIVLFAAMLARPAFAHQASPDSVVRHYVTGVIVDAATGKPLQGVSVSTRNGKSVLTGADGKYQMPVGSYQEMLTYSAPGYLNRTASLRGNQQMDFKMYSESFRSAKDKIENNGSMSVDELMSSLYGGDVRVISRSSVPGVGANMFIRGYHSIHLNAQPLIVIDGVLRNTENVSSAFQGFTINALADIDINDIDKIVIVKDATSIYGSKGANGAIYITTHRGASTTTKIDLNMDWGFTFRPKMMRMMDASQFRSYASEMIKGNGGSTYADQFTGFLNDETDLSKNLSYSTYHNDHEWQDDIYRTGFRQYYGLNVEGGDDVAKYALSVSYMQGDNVLKSTDFDRLSTHFNADVVLAKGFTVLASCDFTHLNRNLLDMGVNEYTSAPYLSLIKSPLLMPNQYSKDGTIYTGILSDVDDFGVSNPVSIINNSKGKYTSYRFGVHIMPKWQITDALDLSESFAYNMDAVKEHYYSPLEGIAPQVQTDGTVYENTVKDQSINQGQLFSDTRLHYAQLFTGDHHVDMALGLRVQSNTYKSNYGEGHNTGSDKVINLSTSLDGKNIDGLKTTVKNSAVYLQASYDYQQRYGIWGVLTEEACSTFGKDVKGGFRFLNGTWATFPSVGANWRLSNEQFMKNVSSINLVNLRVSYGLTGNDGLDVLSRYAYLSPVNYFGNANGLQIGNLGNESLKWETTRKFDAGIDLSVLNDRLAVSFDYFSHTTKDLLVPVQADILTGLGTTYVNQGEMTNNGFEVNVNGRIVNTKNFKWNSELGIAHSVNKITKFGTSQEYTVGDGVILLAEGQAVGTFYGYKTISNGKGKVVFATEAEAQAVNLKTWNVNKSEKLTFHAGDVHFADLNGDGVIDEHDRTVIGNANPDITGSFLNHFEYKSLALDVMFTYSLGNDVYNYQRHTLEAMTNLYNQTEAVTNRWKYEGQETDIPRAVYGDPMANSRFSDRFIEDGSYLKLKEVRLSYRLPLHFSFLQGATAWVSGTNLYTWTKYLGADPEVTYGTSPLTQGVDYGIPTASRTVTFGLKLNF
jgi:TonB-linked SusC/RagA family outer membrane protein